VVSSKRVRQRNVYFIINVEMTAWRVMQFTGLPSAGGGGVR
jgi:hypothetical protein